jgi:hypothetical protein
MESFNLAEIKGRSIYDSVMMPNQPDDGLWLRKLGVATTKIGGISGVLKLFPFFRHLHSRKLYAVIRSSPSEVIALLNSAYRFLLCNQKKMGLKRDKFHRNSSKC